MTRRVVVQLCGTHRMAEFLARDDGWEFTDRLEEAWRSHGVAGTARMAALAAHRRAHGPRPDRSHCPGSYSWPLLRLEAERRYETGEAPDLVIADLRGRHGDGHATVPSVQTMRRWFRERRWLDRPPTPASGTDEASPDDDDEDRGGGWYTRTGKPPHPLRHLALPGMRMELFPALDVHLFDMSRTGPAEDDFGDRWIHGP